MLEPEISQKMTLHAKKSLAEAETIARHYGHAFILPEHLLFAIFLEEGSVGSNILKNMDLKREHFNKFLIKKEPSEQKKVSGAIEFSPALKSVITKAYSLASSFDYPYVGTEHLMYSLVESGSEIVGKILHKSILVKKGTSEGEKEFETMLQNLMNHDSLPHLSKLFDLPEITLSRKNKSSSSTPYLDQFSINLNEESLKRNEIVIGREKELERLIHILGRKNKNNPVLIGDPGVGKTVLVSGLARKISAGEVPEFLLDKKILSLDLALMVAGTSFRGEFENRLKKVIQEAQENSHVILFIDEIHSIVGAGNTSGGLDAANMLKPVLARGDIRCIGATTFSEYKKHIEKDPALERRFQPITVKEPTVQETTDILRGIQNVYEKFHHVSIEPEALESAVTLSARYIQDRFLPDKAIDLLDETASALRAGKQSSELVRQIKKLERERATITENKNSLVSEERYDEAMNLRKKESALSENIEKLKKQRGQSGAEEFLTVTADDIANTVSRLTGIPREKIASSKKRFNISALKKNLEKNIIGQKEATDHIMKTVTRSLSGIGNPHRPLGSFLFLGPTGVGKTLTAKILAREMFGDEKNLMRIDMSEFMERHNVSRLTGAPAGYVGFEEGGKLTEHIRHNPYSLVLFDEIEKAHPDVFNILLQILEDGFLTDAEGRRVNFRNTIIILTSNLGTAEFTNSAKMGFEKQEKNSPSADFEHIRAHVLHELKNSMKPEILNRLDHIVVFQPLNQKDIQKIAALEMEILKKRLIKNGITLDYSSEVISFIAGKSLRFDQGARLVRKNIQEMVENQIAKLIMQSGIKNGTVAASINKEKIKIT